MIGWHEIFPKSGDHASAHSADMVFSDTSGVCVCLAFYRPFIRIKTRKLKSYIDVPANSSRARSDLQTKTDEIYNTLIPPEDGKNSPQRNTTIGCGDFEIFPECILSTRNSCSKALSCPIISYRIL